MDGEAGGGEHALNTALEVLLGDTTLSDISFLCKDNQTVHACKAFLAARSQYFRTMLYGHMQEAHTKHIQLHTVNSKPFKLVLEYLHTNDIQSIHHNILQQPHNNNTSQALDIKLDEEELHDDEYQTMADKLLEALDLSRLYRLPKLSTLIKDKLKIIMEKRLTLIPNIVAAALALHCDEVALCAIDVLNANPITDSTFLGFPEDVVGFIVSGLMNHHNGDQVMKAILQWAKWKLVKMKTSKPETVTSDSPEQDSKEMLKEILKNITHHIKFECVSPEFVEEELESQELIPASELLRIYKKQAKRPAMEMDFSVGDVIICKDCKGKFYEAQVTEVTSDSIRVHYIGWSSSWDEWIRKNDPDRIALRTNQFSKRRHISGGGHSTPPSTAAAALRTMELLRIGRTEFDPEPGNVDAVSDEIDSEDDF